MTENSMYSRIIGGFAVGVLTLSLAACGGNDDNNEAEPDVDNTEVTENETETTDESTEDNNEETAADAEPLDDPEFISTKLDGFMEEVSEAGISDELWTALGSSSSSSGLVGDPETEELLQVEYETIVEAHFDIEDASDVATYENEYMLIFFLAAMESDQMAEQSGLKLGTPQVYTEHINIDTEAETAEARGFFIEMFRQYAEELSAIDEETADLSDASDQEVVDAILEDEAEEDVSLLFALEYENNEWYIDAETTLRNIGSM